MHIYRIDRPGHPTDGTYISYAEPLPTVGAGAHGEYSYYTPVDKIPPLSIDDILNSIRIERNSLLTSSDWTQIPDNQLSPDIREAWRVYRQELRDLLEKHIDLENLPQFPVPPQS
jgi:hypothetical protein